MMQRGVMAYLHFLVLAVFSIQLQVIGAQNAVLQDKFVVFSSNATAFSLSSTYMGVFTQQIASFFNVNPTYVTSSASNVQSGQLDVNYVITIPCTDNSALATVQGVLNSGCCSGLVKAIGQAQLSIGAPIWGLKRVSAPPSLVGPCVTTTTTTTVVAATLVDTLVVLSTDPVAFASQLNYINSAANQVASFYNVPASYVNVVAVNVIVGQQLDLRYTIAIPCTDASSLTQIQNVLSNNCCGGLVKAVGIAAMSLKATLTAVKRTTGPPTLSGTCVTPITVNVPQAAWLKDRLRIVTNTPLTFTATASYLSAVQSQVASFYNVQVGYVNYTVMNVLNNQLDVIYFVTVPCSDTPTIAQVITVLNGVCCADLVKDVGQAVVNLGADLTAVKRPSGVPGLYGPCGPLGIVQDKITIFTADQQASGFASNSQYLSAITAQIAAFYNVDSSYVSLSTGNLQRKQVDVNYTVAAPCHETPPMLAVLKTGCCVGLLDNIGESAVSLGAPITHLKRNNLPPIVSGPCSLPSVLVDTLTILTGDPNFFTANPLFLQVAVTQIAAFYGVNATYVSIAPANYQARSVDLRYNLTVTCGDQDAVNSIIDTLSNGCCSALVTAVGRAEVAVNSGILGVKRQSGLPLFYGPCAPRIVTTATTTQMQMAGSHRGYVQLASCLAFATILNL
jgi:hypothetical protein